MDTIVGIVFVLTTALVAARLGLSGPSIILAAISSLATIFGAFCAPTSFTTLLDPIRRLSGALARRSSSWPPVS